MQEAHRATVAVHTIFHNTNNREDQQNRSPTQRRSWFSTPPNRIASSPTTRHTTFKSMTCQLSFASSERSTSWTSWTDRLLTAVKTSDALLLVPTLNSSSLSLNSRDTHGYQTSRDAHCPCLSITLANYRDAGFQVIASCSARSRSTATLCCIAKA